MFKKRNIHPFLRKKKQNEKPVCVISTFNNLLNQRECLESPTNLITSKWHQKICTKNKHQKSIFVIFLVFPLFLLIHQTKKVRTKPKNGKKHIINPPKNHCNHTVSMYIYLYPAPIALMKKKCLLLSMELRRN